MRLADQFAWHRAALKGNPPPINENDPQPGFYKVRRGRDEPWQPCAIWWKDGKLLARVGGKMVDPHAIWTWAAKNPIAAQHAREAFTNGHFPGELPRDHNKPPQTLAEEIDEAVIMANAWLEKSTIHDKLTMDMAANMRSRLLELANKADKERTEKKAPHLKATREIDAEYMPLVKRAKDAADPLRIAVGKYMAEQERIEREKREAERKAAEEERLRMSPVDMVSAPLPPPPEPVKIQAGGQRGKKTGLVTQVRFEIEDRAKLVEQFINADEVTELLFKLAVARARTGVEVPGLKRIEERVAR